MLHVLVDPPLAHCVEEEGLPLLRPHVQLDVQCTVYMVDFLAVRRRVTSYG